MKKNLQVGLFGFGCVGQGLYHALQESKGVSVEIKRICIKNENKPRSIGGELFTAFREELLRDPDIDVIVELTDDPVEAFEIIKAALQSGKSVVTANKRMLAERLPEIYALQKKHNRSVLYEGAVCGSIPIIRNLEAYYENDTIRKVEGIFNGSTNYILTKVSEEGKSYEEALHQAQTLGFAESDPRLDVQGYDPTFKLAILIAHTFGIWVHPTVIVRIGIDRISPFDFKYAKANKLNIKLVASAHRCGDEIFGLVAPQYVPEFHPLSMVRNEFNAVVVEGAFAEEQLFVGKGAGGNPTGSAVLSDIATLHYDYKYGYKKIDHSLGLEFSNEATVQVIISFGGTLKILPQEFIEFKGGFRGHGYQHMQGIIDLQTLKNWSQKEGLGVILAPETVPVGRMQPKMPNLALA